MPRRNRVTPFGDIIACPERGTYMGNRGNLHDENGRIRRSWQVKRWLICLLEFRGRHRTIMTLNRHTALCLLDEAIGLSCRSSICSSSEAFHRVRGGRPPSSPTRSGAEIDEEPAEGPRMACSEPSGRTSTTCRVFINVDEQGWDAT